MHVLETYTPCERLLSLDAATCSCNPVNLRLLADNNNPSLRVRPSSKQTQPLFKQTRPPSKRIPPHQRGHHPISMDTTSYLHGQPLPFAPMLIMSTQTKELLSMNSQHHSRRWSLPSAPTPIVFIQMQELLSRQPMPLYPLIF